MKKLFTSLLIVKLFFCFSTLTAQQWLDNIPQNQVENDNLSFFDVQKSFNDYWAPFDVKRGYYYVNGEKIKAAGWKQFKRWEWFWNDRVDPRTGAFPQTSAVNELGIYLKEHPQLKSTNGTSGNWTSMGPVSTSGGYAGLGRLSCVAFSPASSSVIYVGAASGGLWKSTNGGTSWVPMSDNTAVLGISDLLVLPGTSGDVIYAATGDRDASDNYSVGVLKSLDGGNTWNTTGLNWSQSSLRLIYRLLGDPTNPSALYAATSAGVYKTTDGGNTWTNLTTSKFINIKFKPGSNQIMYGSTVSTGDIYLSTNGGTTWTIVLNTAGTRVEMAVTPANPELVYALISSTSNGLLGVFKSTNSGALFTQVFGPTPNIFGWNCDGSDSGGQGWYDMCLAADPNNADIVFAGGVNTWKTSNGGTVWAISNHWASTCGGKATTVHADKHFLAFQPGTSSLFECNDGGLYKTENSGTNWTHLGNGLAISQMYRLGVSQTSATDVITGLQDNGTKAMLSGTWRDVIGGDGMECAIDYTNNNVQYGELYYGDIYRTDNRWTSSTYITGSITGYGGWVTPFVMDPSNSNTLYCGFQDVWKTTDKGATWTKISAWNLSSLRSLAVAPSNSNTIYAATGSILYRTTDGGANWANITGTLPVNYSNITYLAVKQNDPNTVWVSFGQFNAYSVYQSTDGGATWTNISSGLPSIPVNCVIQNKQNTGQTELYAGTDVGVFIKVGTAAWVPYFTGLPNVVVMELEIYYAIDPARSKIRAATYGRGLWESDVYTGAAVLNSPPAFTTDPITEAGATEGSAYSATLADNATDPNTGDVLTFTMVSGPSWLTLAGSGALSGIPATTNVGLNSFTVKVEDGKGGSDQAIMQITVSALAVQPPVADFSATPLSLLAGQTVAFTDLSTNTPTGWLWYFGDGSTSALRNPSYTYNNAGTYTVTLTATNSAGSNVKTVVDYISVSELNSPPVISPDPIVEVEAVSGNSYSSTLVDHATDPNANDVLNYSLVSGPAWLVLSTNGKLSGTPAAANLGLNNFSVKVDDGKGGSDLATLQINVSALIVKPVANFEAGQVSIFSGQAVQFSDLSQNSPTGWLWNFGDGKTSVQQNPSNTYSAAGTYSVSLTASNSAGSDTKTMANYIVVTDRPDLSYCQPSGINNSSDYITSVVIGGTTSNSGRGSSGYLLYNSPSFNLMAGKSSTVILTPVNSRTTSKAFWRIWIDFNFDGDFTDTGENVLDINKKGKYSGSVLIPATAVAGATRMRIAMKANTTMNACDNNFTGEVEDYLVTILPMGLVNGGGEIAAEENPALPILKLYPNPATSQLNISVENPAGTAVLRVFNILGSQLELIPVSSNLMQIDLTKYSRGVYFILLEDQKQRVGQKFIKE